MLIVSTVKLPTGMVQAIGRDDRGRTYAVTVQPHRSSTQHILEVLQLAADLQIRPGENV